MSSPSEPARGHRLVREDCMLVVVDVQDRLLPAIHEGARVVAESRKLILGARALGVPILWSEQYRKGLGGTNEAIVEAIGDAAEPMEKMTFGCLADDAQRAAVEATGRRTLVLCGMEAHVCVMQTAVHALDLGMRVVLPRDAVGSRRASDAEAGIARMERSGVVPATVESLLMEWTGRAGTDEFKKILAIIK